jgi:hypothetical protein
MASSISPLGNPADPAEEGTILIPTTSHGIVPIEPIEVKQIGDKYQYTGKQPGSENIIRITGFPLKSTKDRKKK